MTPVQLRLQPELQYVIRLQPELLYLIRLRPDAQHIDYKETRQSLVRYLRLRLEPKTNLGRTLLLFYYIFLLI